MVQVFRPKIGRAAYRGSKARTSEASFGQTVKSQLNDMIHNYMDWVNSIDSQSADILQEALEPTMELSLELVPRKTHRLANSAYLQVGRFRGKATVEMGYAKGGDPDYAVFVHENLDVYHAPPTQAKFLQHALEVDASNIEERIKRGFAMAAGFSQG